MVSVLEVVELLFIADVGVLLVTVEVAVSNLWVTGQPIVLVIRNAPPAKDEVPVVSFENSKWQTIGH